MDGGGIREPSSRSARRSKRCEQHCQRAADHGASITRSGAAHLDWKINTPTAVGGRSNFNSKDVTGRNLNGTTP
jgi:hypothetical protein